MQWKSVVSIVGQALVVLLLSNNVRCGKLSEVTKVAIDTKRVLETSMTVRAILARFDNRNSAWIQLWKPARKNRYSLVWQYKTRASSSHHGVDVYETINLPESHYIEVKENYVLGMANDVTPGPMTEVYSERIGLLLSVQDSNINLPESHYIEVKENYVLGMANDVTPGPMTEVYSERIGLLLSVQDSNVRGMPIREGTEFEFDDLSLPYNLPVCLCNFTGCPEYHKKDCRLKKSGMPTMTGPKGNNSPDVKSVSSTDNSVLMSEEMIIGLITWNVLLTFIVFVVVMVLMWVCADMEKMKKNERSRKARVVNSPSMQSASTSSTRKRWPSNSSVGSNSTRSRSTLPGSHDVTL